jgi:hypothetical protein
MTIVGDVAALLAQAKPTPLPVRRVIAARPASSYR